VDKQANAKQGRVLDINQHSCPNMDDFSKDNMYMIATCK